MANGVHIRGLSRYFQPELPVLDGISLDIAPGEFIALLGRSGSGKSTLLRILAGLDEQFEAQRFDRPTSVAVAFQESRLYPWLRVWRNVVLNLKTDRRRQIAEAALSEVGLAEKMDVWPLTLSGGQAQRVSLARALACKPELLLLDEPFGALDALTRLSMHKLVLSLWRRHRPGVLLVTHDVDEAVLLADRVLVLEAGRIVANVAITATRPRKMTNLQLDNIKTELLATLGVNLQEQEQPETHEQ